MNNTSLYFNKVSIIMLALLMIIVTKLNLSAQTKIYKAAPENCFGCNLDISLKTKRSPAFVTNYVKVDKKYERFSNAELARQIRLDTSTLFLRAGGLRKL